MGHCLRHDPRLPCRRRSLEGFPPLTPPLASLEQQRRQASAYGGHCRAWRRTPSTITPFVLAHRSPTMSFEPALYCHRWAGFLDSTIHVYPAQRLACYYNWRAESEHADSSFMLNFDRMDVSRRLFAYVVLAHSLEHFPISAEQHSSSKRTDADEECTMAFSPRLPRQSLPSVFQSS